MRFPFFGRRRDEPVRVPMEKMVHVGYGVCFRADGASIPEADDLNPMIREWLAAHTSDPLLEVAVGYMEQSWVKIHIGSRDLLPRPPADLLRHIGAGEEEVRRYEEATHLVIVSAPDVAVHVRVGLWSALGAARAIARHLGGVIMDPELPRLEPIASHEEPLPADASLKLREHIILPCSVDERGLAWITSKGMGKLGLPDLEIVDVPPHLAHMVMSVMNGLARHLANAAVQQIGADRQPPKELLIGPEIRLGLEDLATDPEDAPAELPEGIRGWTMIRLEYRPGRRGKSAFVRLLPPRGFRGDQGVWLHSLLSDLMGTEDTLRQVKEDSEPMEAAHLRAVAELPRAKQRLEAGLAAGETLLVKHGFPTNDGSHEFMWIAVNSWSGGRLRGHLVNDPQWRLDLQAGQTVELSEAEVFDWMIYRSDEDRDGGYTLDVTLREGRESE